MFYKAHGSGFVNSQCGLSPTGEGVRDLPITLDKLQR